jgi:hypothetical protein
VIRNLIFLLLISVECHASCREDFQTVVDEFAPAASALGGKQIRATVFLTSRLGASTNAVADPRVGRIWITETMCSAAENQKRRLVAHELGHYVAHALYPRVAEDAYSGHALQIGVSVHEGLANQYAELMLLPG